MNSEITPEDLKRQLDKVEAGARRTLTIRRAQIIMGTVLIVSTAVAASYFLGKRRGRASGSS